MDNLERDHQQPLGGLNGKRQRDPTADQYTSEVGPPQKKGALASSVPSALPGIDRQYLADLDASVSPFTQADCQGRGNDELPPIGLFAPPRPSSGKGAPSKKKPTTSVVKAGRVEKAQANPRTHRRDSGLAVSKSLNSFHLHQNNNNINNQQKQDHIIDFTSDGAPTAHQPKTTPHLRLSPPKSVPPQLSPAKKSSTIEVQPEARSKEQQLEQEAQSKADEQLARQLQEAEHRTIKTRRLRHKTDSPEKRAESQQKRTQRQRSLRSASPVKRPAKKLTEYEEYQKIQQKAAQDVSRRPRKRTLSVSPEKATKRTHRGSTPEQHRASKQATRTNMNRANTEELDAIQDQFKVQARASASVGEDRRKMPPPPPPQAATGYSPVPFQGSSTDITPNGTQPKPSNPLNPPRPRYNTQNTLHKAHKAKVTKQSYHTAHKQPDPFQEAQKRRQERRAREEKEARDNYVWNYTRHRDALDNGVTLYDVENNSVAHDLCRHIASNEYRLGHLPTMNPNAPLPSIENAGNFTADAELYTSDLGRPFGYNDSPKNHVDLTSPPDEFSAPGASSVNEDAASAPTDGFGLTNIPLKDSDYVFPPIFDTTVPHDRVLEDPDACHPESEEGLFNSSMGQPGTFLEPIVDADGFLRAPDMGVYTEESALVEELLMHAEEEQTSNYFDEASGWY